MHWTVSLEGGPRRVNHAAVAIGDKIYSFGGYCTGEDYNLFRPIDVHVLNTVSYRWSAVPLEEAQIPNMPFQRYGHTAVAFDDNIYLWGGRNDGGGCNVLYAFDIQTRKWSKPVTNGRIPFPRDGHSACIIEDVMYIFGGYEEYGLLSQEVCSLDLKSFTWTHIITKGEPPTWRDFHTATPIGSRMYIFGGRGDEDGPYHTRADLYCNEIFYLDVKTMTWYKPSSTDAPIGRRSHSAFVFRNQLFIFGGYNDLIRMHFGEIYRYDTDTCIWHEVEISGTGPCARRRQHCCLVGNKLFLFGGTSPRADPLPESEFPDLLNDVNPNLMDHSDLHVLDFLPSLKTLCILLVIENKISQDNLPSDIRWEISAMTTNNSITRPVSNTG